MTAYDIIKKTVKLLKTSFAAIPWPKNKLPIASATSFITLSHACRRFTKNQDNEGKQKGKKEL